MPRFDRRCAIADLPLKPESEIVDARFHLFRGERYGGGREQKKKKSFPDISTLQLLVCTVNNGEGKRKNKEKKKLEKGGGTYFKTAEKGKEETVWWSEMKLFGTEWKWEEKLKSEKQSNKETW